MFEYTHKISNIFAKTALYIVYNKQQENTFGLGPHGLHKDQQSLDHNQRISKEYTSGNSSYKLQYK